jgi:1-phosphofructokinase family hexose kinase
MRAHTAQSFPGGKSTHVAMVLRTLGETPHWVGPCGGASGSELVEGLAALGIEAHPSPTHQRTRTNLEIIEDDGRVTEIREPGAAPSLAELAAFELTCELFFEQGRETMSVIFSGSLPEDTGPDLYARLMGMAGERGCRTFLDTSGAPLRLGLAAHPYFVKPNRDEAAGLLGEPIDSLCAAATAVSKLLSLGARRAALSLGAEGLLYCAAKNGPVLFAPSLALEVRSTVGCGDAALAGFAKAIAADSSPQETLRLAAACAAANCVAESPGAARSADIKDFQAQIRVQTLPSSP